MDAVVDRDVGDVPIEISVLGGFDVRTGLSFLHFPTRKARALLAYLAIAGDRPRDRETLQALLWPESGKFQAQASLRQTLFSLRQTLSPHSPGAFRANGTSLALDGSQVRVDLAIVEGALAEGTYDSLEHVSSLCTGPLLDGFAAGEAEFDQWVELERMQLQERIVRAFEKLADLHVKAGRIDRAIETARQSLRLGPLQERTHRTLMRLYAMHGRRAEAVQLYEMCVATLRRELGVDPAEQTKRLHRDILREPCANEIANGDRPERRYSREAS